MTDANFVTVTCPKCGSTQRMHKVFLRYCYMDCKECKHVFMYTG
jgi:ribosomal protein S27E